MRDARMRETNEEEEMRLPQRNEWRKMYEEREEEEREEEEEEEEEREAMYRSTTSLAIVVLLERPRRTVAEAESLET